MATRKIDGLWKPCGALCPACLLRPGSFSGDVGAGNSFSRYATVYICSDCGTREALEGFFWRSHCTAVIKPHHRRTRVIIEGPNGFRNVKAFQSEAVAERKYRQMTAICSQGGTFRGVKIDAVHWTSQHEAGA